MTDYDFRTLSPGDFEHLACDVLNVDLGLRFQTFPAGRDDGIDLRDVEADGTVVVAQCKHYVDSDRATFTRAVTAESNKSAIRTAGRYIFVTSHPLSPRRQSEVADILGIDADAVWGPGRINRVLREHPEIERRHFKLWMYSAAVMSRIVDAGLWQRTEARLEEIMNQAVRWVDIPALSLLRSNLETTGVCLITGDPGVGKTFLAERVMLEALGDGWHVMDVSGSIEEAWAAVGPGEKRLCLLDDVFGRVRLRHDALDLAPDLLRLVSHVGRHNDRLRLILTTRDQVLTDAVRLGSDDAARLVDGTSRCSVTTADLDPATRMEILVSHLHFSELPPEEVARLSADPTVRALTMHPAFNPRLIRTATETSASRRSGHDIVSRLAEAFANPAEVWHGSFTVLDQLAAETVVALATFPARSIPPRLLKSVAAPDTRALPWKQSAASLGPTWIKTVGNGSDKAVRFSSTGCREYVLGLLASDDELAWECVTDRIRHLEQLTSLSQSAGLLPADDSDPHAERRTRGALADALLAHRAELARQVERLWSEWNSRADRTLADALTRLREAASLLAIFGGTDDATWLIQEVERLVDDNPELLPCIESLALARTLMESAATSSTARGGLAERLVEAGLANAVTLRDLEAYEELPASMMTPAVADTARRTATKVFRAELEELASETVHPRLLEAEALDLESRARWYGADIDIDPILEIIDRMR